MDEKIKKTGTYLYNRRNLLLLAFSLTIVFLLIQEIPFFNLFLPQSTPITVFVISIIILLGLFKNPVFLLVLTLITIFLFFLQLTSQAEQMANLIFLLILTFVIVEIFNYCKNIK